VTSTPKHVNTEKMADEDDVLAIAYWCLQRTKKEPKHYYEQVRPVNQFLVSDLCYDWYELNYVIS